MMVRSLAWVDEAMSGAREGEGVRRFPSSSLPSSLPSSPRPIRGAIVSSFVGRCRGSIVGREGTYVALLTMLKLVCDELEALRTRAKIQDSKGESTGGGGGRGRKLRARELARVFSRSALPACPPTFPPRRSVRNPSLPTHTRNYPPSDRGRDSDPVARLIYLHPCPPSPSTLASASKPPSPASPSSPRLPSNRKVRHRPLVELRAMRRRAS